MLGEVHDPRAWALGGVAGHAGLFSTARDLSRFAQAWLKKAHTGGASLASPATIDAFRAPHDLPGGLRTLGWDMMSSLSKQRGAGFSWHAFGHGGFTGTALWLDPEAGFFVLFLSNRVHPRGKGGVQELVAQLGTLAARVVAAPPPPLAVEAPCDRGTSEVLAGIDVLRAQGFASLKGKRVALLANGAARAKDGTRTIELLSRAPGVELVRVFTPEHGVGADQEGKLADARDPVTGTPLVSLYGTVLEPPPGSLEDVQALVVDLPDVGARFYTYASTMHRALRAAAAARVPVVVLDRPDPLGGVEVSGPLPDASSRGFVHHAALPVRHGLTLGELGLLFDADEHLGAELRIVRAQGWRRSDYLDATTLAWVPPSPNLRTLTEAILYPGVALLEGTNVSVGRGTDAPFELVGAPYVDGDALAAQLIRAQLPGVTFSAATFTPQAAPFRGERCGGVRVTLTDRARFEPVRLGVALALALRGLYPRAWHVGDLYKLLAHRPSVDAITQGLPLADVEATWAGDLAAFRAKREKYLLYRATCPR
jgi:uncharacterized protein YbbC (DUF1343 family)